MSSATTFPATSGAAVRSRGRAVTRARASDRHLSEPAPWSRRHLVASAAVLIAGVIALFVGWYGISREVSFRQQTGWLVLSIGATVISMIGLAVTMIAGFREVRRAERQIAAEFRDLFGLTVRPVAGDEAERAAHRSAEPRVTLVGLNRVHVASCPMVEGKPVTSLSADQLRNVELQRCGVCRP